MLELETTIVCPSCGHRETERMHEGVHQYFYRCKGCAKILKPINGDCCVFCSFGDVPCPTTQMKAPKPHDHVALPAWFLL